MKRLLFVNFVGETSGSVKSLHYLVEHLKSSHEITIAFAKGGDYIQKFVKLGCRVLRVNTAQLANTAHQPYGINFDSLLRVTYFFVRSPFDIIRWLMVLKKENPSTLYINNIVIATPAIAAKILGIRVIWHVRELILDNYLGKIQKKVILSLSSKVLFTTNYAANSFPDSNNKHIISNGIKIDDYAKLGFEISTEIPAAKNKKIVLMWASLTPLSIGAKGFLVFIDAAKMVCKSNLEAVFLICGGQRESEPFKELSRYIDQKGLAKQVFLLGNRSDMYKYIVNSDICVSPHTKRESFGRTILEAGVCSKPIITTRMEPTTEIIQDGQNGLLAEAGDSVDLASKIEYLLLNSDVSKNLGKRLNSDVLAKYEIGQVNRKIASLIGVLDNG